MPHVAFARVTPKNRGDLGAGFGERQLSLCQLRAWVPMVNHVHISIYPEARLSRITKAIKNHSARQANAIFAHHWAHRLAVLARVRGPEELAKIVRYIEENPVAAGLVSRGENWRWSSAFGMAGGQARRPVPLK